MKTSIAALFLCLLALATSAHAGENKMPKTWFSDRDVSVLEVKHFNYAIDGHAPINTARIDDQEAIKKIMHQIEQLPADGPEFRSFKPKELLELNFVAKESKQVVSIYDGHFKTPSTGFNTSSEAEKSEALIYNDILSLFEAKENMALFQIKGHEYKFPDFVIVYEGVEHFDHAPVTVSGQRHIFTIKSKDGDERAVISSGQLPPQPYPFTVGKKAFTLQTYRTNSGQLLPIDAFMVEAPR